MIALCAAWDRAGITGKMELQRMLFPTGLVYSAKTDFLNSKNEALMHALDLYFQSLPNLSFDLDSFQNKLGRPGRD